MIPLRQRLQAGARWLRDYANVPRLSLTLAWLLLQSHVRRLLGRASPPFAFAGLPLPTLQAWRGGWQGLSIVGTLAVPGGKGYSRWAT